MELLVVLVAVSVAVVIGALGMVICCCHRRTVSKRTNSSNMLTSLHNRCLNYITTFRTRSGFFLSWIASQLSQALDGTYVLSCEQTLPSCDNTEPKCDKKLSVIG